MLLASVASNDAGQVRVEETVISRKPRGCGQKEKRSNIGRTNASANQALLQSNPDYAPYRILTHHGRGLEIKANYRAATNLESTKQIKYMGVTLIINCNIHAQYSYILLEENDLKWRPSLFIMVQNQAVTRMVALVFSGYKTYIFHINPTEIYRY
jgi:hypothetical protein